jgi:hypothetical protein
MTLEAQCPNPECQVVFPLDDFEPEEDDQTVDCPECGETYALEYDGTTLTLIPFDEGEEDEEDLALLSEDDAEDDEEDEDAL